MKRNKEVIEHFLSGKPASNRNLHSDGKTLKSYALPIAQFHNSKLLVPLHDEFIPNYELGGQSVTTKRHIGLLKRSATEYVETPYLEEKLDGFLILEEKENE